MATLANLPDVIGVILHSLSRKEQAGTAHKTPGIRITGIGAQN